MVAPAYTLDLLAEFKEKLEYTDYAHGIANFIAQTYRVNFEGSIEGFTVKKAFSVGLSAVEDMYEGLSSTTSFYCSKEMSQLVERAALSLDSTDVADSKYIPTDNGFCYFDNGITISVDDGKSTDLLAHVLIWSKDKDSGRLALFFFNDPLNQPDNGGRNYLEAKLKDPNFFTTFGRFIPNAIGGYQPGKTIVSGTNLTSEEISHGLENGTYATPVVGIASVAHALFMLIGQTVVSSEPVRATKKGEKRLKKSGTTPEVRVVALRRVKKYEKGDGDSTPVEWTVRWIVGGHWRWQPYKNESGEIYHERIWINPYVKGPEDKPLHVTKKVYALVK